jgi:hypothetical protein
VESLDETAHAKGAEVVDLTRTAASDDELRRRAAEGDQQALAELARRQAAELREAA